jgi:hypothetical protein
VDCNGLGGIEIVVQPESVPADDAQLFIDKPASEYPSLELELRSEFGFEANTFRMNFLTRLRPGRCDFSNSKGCSSSVNPLSSSKTSRSLSLNMVSGVSGDEQEVYKLNGEFEIP